MKSDTLFTDAYFEKGGFTFNESVTQVFDDMIHRSIPNYHDMQSQILEFIFSYFSINTSMKVYDLGCYTANFLKHLSLFKDKLTKDEQFCYVGVDNSKSMLKKANEWFQTASNDFKNCVSVEWLNRDLNHYSDIKNANVIVLNLVLQFLPIENRLSLLKCCHNGLEPGGLCFLIEKIQYKNHHIQHLFTERYHSYKLSNSYTLKEIANKDNALKDVLIPLTYDDNMELLKSAGFSVTVPFFQWFNFVGFIAIK